MAAVSRSSSPIQFEAPKELPTQEKINEIKKIVIEYLTSEPDLTQVKEMGIKNNKD